MRTSADRESKRLSVDVGPKARDRLNRLSAETEQSLSEVIRNAVALYHLLWTELTAEPGRRLVIKSADGTRETEVVIPEFQP